MKLLEVTGRIDRLLTSFTFSNQLLGLSLAVLAFLIAMRGVLALVVMLLRA